MVPTIEVAGAWASVVCAVGIVATGITWTVRFIYKKGQESEARRRQAEAERIELEVLRNRHPQLPQQDTSSGRYTVPSKTQGKSKPIDSESKNTSA